MTEMLASDEVAHLSDKLWYCNKLSSSPECNGMGFHFLILAVYNLPEEVHLLYAICKVSTTHVGI